MQTKFIAAGVLVILSCSSSVFSSTSCCGRSENVSDGLSKLESDRTEAISDGIDASILFFEAVNKFVFEYVANLKPKTPENHADVNKAEALRIYKKATDHILSSILFALGECCNGIDTARAAIYACLEDGVEALAQVIAMVLSGDCSDNQAAIDFFEARSKNDGAGIIRETYKLIRNCSKTIDTDVLAAIETAENGSVAGIQRAVNAVVDATKFVAAAITSGNKSLSLLYDVQEYQAQTLAGVREKSYHEYAILEALYASSCLNKTGFVSDFAVMQYGTIKRADNAGNIITCIFAEIINLLNRIEFGISNDGDEVPSQIDAAEAKVVNAVNTSDNHLLDSILSIYSVDPCVIADVRTAILDQTKIFAASLFNMIRVAADQSKPCSTIKTDININKNKAILSFVATIKDWISVIPKNQTCNNELENNFEAIINQAINYGVEYILGIRDAAVILAKIVHANGTVFTDDISAIQEAKSRGASALANYINTVPVALRFWLLASNRSSP